MFDPQDLAERLGHLLRTQGAPDAVVRDLRVMPDGHAGLTFGLTVTQAGALDGPAVLKVGPPGVPRRGSTDIYRQARLLQALHSEGLPVPAILLAGADEDRLGGPFILMQKLPGRVFVPWEPDASFPQDAHFVRGLWLQAVRALAGIHRLDWTQVLGDWEAPYTLASELERWHSLLRHAPDPAWGEAGRRVHAALIAQPPPEAPVGLVHGDFQPGNALYEDGRLMGVIDWDLAGIGAQGADVGWLLMMVDPAAWVDGWRPVAPVARDELLAIYREAGGTAVGHLDWFQAFAQFRLGAIACLNVKLHRNGRRHDPLWERFAPAVSSLFARAQALLAQTSHRNTP